MHLTPQQIVKELDKHIIGQTEAKKAVAIALRNRWRRQQVAQPLQHEITPKNILMIGPTGVGKTEIARRLAKLANAPFIKVEATKFTEVGYVGKEVESIIRDLVDISFKDIKRKAQAKNQKNAKARAEEKILDILLSQHDEKTDNDGSDTDAKLDLSTLTAILTQASAAAKAIVSGETPSSSTETPKIKRNKVKTDTSDKDLHNYSRDELRAMLKKGQLDNKEIEVNLSLPKNKIAFVGAPGLEDISNQLQNLFDATTENQKKKRRLTVASALIAITGEEASKLIDEDEIRQQCINSVEQNGIVFIDEIDKVIAKNAGNNVDVSRSGVQRDLLPLVEGTTVNTRYGMINTDHILFIASGAFHIAKPSDLLPELQGRFPIRVELNSLTVDDFVKILTATDACLIEQYKALLATENSNIVFNKDGIRKIAEIAFNVNKKTENIGARRLYTIMERLLSEVSFIPQEHPKVKIDTIFVTKQLGEIAKSEDLSRYIL